MGEPALKMTPEQGDEQPNTETPDNVISWEQAMQYFDDKFTTLASEIQALESRTDQKMEESEQRSKKYADTRLENAQSETKKHIGSLETLIQDVVSGVRKSLEEMRDIVGGARKDAAYMRGAASDLLTGQRQNSEQIDALQGHDVQHVKDIATLKNEQAATVRELREVSTQTHQNTSLLQRFEEGFAPMNEFFKRELERQNNRRRFWEQVKSYLLTTRQGNTIVGAAVGGVLSFVAENTGIDTEALSQSFFQFIESIF